MLNPEAQPKFKHSSSMDRLKPAKSKNNHSKRIYVNFILFIYFITSLILNGLFSPLSPRGFFCDDDSIRYPVRPDTFTFRALMIYCLIIPLVVIYQCDKLLNKANMKNRNQDHESKHLGNIELTSGDYHLSNGDEEDLANPESAVKKRLLNIGPPIESNDKINDQFSVRYESKLKFWDIHDGDQTNCSQEFVFGACTNFFLTGIGKIAIGRMRPHFMERCKPDIDCSLSKNMARYIEDFKCSEMSRDSTDYNYITTSWPSGHASLAFYAMIYFSAYLHNVIPKLRRLNPGSRLFHWFNPLVLSFISVLMISLAFYISLTRISDYQHHPLDVLSGAILGSLVALVSSRLSH